MNEVLQWIAIAIAVAVPTIPAVTRVVRDFKEEEEEEL